MRLFPLLMLAFHMVGPAPLRADEIANLYQVRVPVGEQSRQTLDEATRQGLAQLLVRLSGRDDAPRHAGLRNALDNAGRYLEQYRYDRAEPGADRVAPWLAVLKFAEQPVNALVRGAGLPLWGANRPVVMMWIAKDEVGGRVLVSEATHPELVAAMRREAERRGVLLRFPLLDLDDLARISAEEVWSLDGLALEDASQRYGTAAVAGARVTELSDGRWLGSWRLAAGEQRITVDAEGDDREAFIADGLAAIARALADQYALQPGAAGASTELRLALTGVDNFEQYTAALRYFADLAEVGSVALLAVDDDRLVLRLDTKGGAAHLQRTLALDSAVVPGDTPSGSQAELAYRWRGR